MIDRTIKEVWVKNILKDYVDGALLREDSLKCGFYYHLRRKLSPVLKQHNIRIFPEFYIKDLKYRPDMVIVKMDWESKADSLKDMVCNIYAILEFKYLAGKSQATNDVIKNDIQKMKKYKQNSLEAQHYCGIIYESEMENLKWVDRRTTNNWADGNLSILTGDLRGEYMWFQTTGYNGMNLDIDSLK